MVKTLKRFNIRCDASDYQNINTILAAMQSRDLYATRTDAVRFALFVAAIDPAKFLDFLSGASVPVEAAQ